CRRDARQVVAADAHAEEHLRAVDVREAGAVGQRPAALEQLERRPKLAALHARPGLGLRGAGLELDRTRREHGGARVVELLERLSELVVVRERLRAREHGLDAAALVGGNALLEETGVDAELGCEPLDRLARGPGLPALDLADVFLGETVACEVGLRQARSDAQLPDALAEAGAAGLGGSADLTGDRHAGHIRAGRSETQA